MQREPELFADDQVQAYADWVLGLGTAPGARQPTLGFNLGNPRTLALYGDALRAIRPGDRVRIVDLPEWMSPEPVELMVQAIAWSLAPGTDVAVVALTCTPGEPWHVAYASPDTATAADEFEPHVDVGDAETVAVLDASQTAFTVAVHSDVPFSETAADLTGGCLITLGGEAQGGQETMGLGAVSPFLVDTFARTVASGWGSPDTGPAWNNFASGGAGSSVSGGLGVLSSLGASSDSAVHTSQVGGGWEMEGQWSLSALPSGASLFVAVRMDWDVASGHMYQVGFTISTAGAITMSCDKIVSGVFVASSSAVLPFTIIAADTVSWRVSVKRGRVRGLALKASSLGNATGWQVQLNSDGIELNPAAFGLYAFRGAGASNAPNVRWDNLRSRSPQVFSVTRGYWGWADGHAVRTPVALRYPWRIGL